MTHEWTFQKKVSAGFVVMVCLALVTTGDSQEGLRRKPRLEGAMLCGRLEEE